MPLPLVECIPNFSEARRPEVIEAIEKAITAVPEAVLLDRHSDLDHNRTVLTFAGPPDAVEEAAYQAISRAAELIDLNKHSGAHPRIGATDVVPFVPLSGVSMEECIAMARRLGQRVGSKLNIPVYLYEEAAACPERRNLEDLRRGQYESLRREIGENPDRAPDFGPASLGTAGATVIGARQPLIAFNVYLTTDDVNIARAIARSIRHSSGGLRYVKALGMLVEGRAQVSMNLSNFRQTPIARVVEMIRSEAARYGVGIHHSELVGLIPQEALVDTATWHLQLDKFKPDQILEQRLYAAFAKASSAAPGSEFLDDLAAATPTPGGGAAAAYAAAMAAGLVAMVARLTIGKKKYASVENQMKEILAHAERLRADLSTAVEADSAAYESVLATFKLPKETEEQEQARMAAIETATKRAANVPLQVARQAVDVLSLAERCAALGNLNAISDAASATALAQAALTSAGYNVRTNALHLQEEVTIDVLMNELRILEDHATELDEKVRSTLTERGGLSLV